MEVTINGATEHVAENATVADVLATYGHKATAVVVEHNGNIVPRETFASVRLTVGDRLEIVHFVGGG
ncbi:MAG: sulfur carrier protein ThiS [Desulfovibrio sp.]|nr:sulfur carrier protein ThiS [Desulfovibrio sp.]